MKLSFMYNNVLSVKKFCRNTIFMVRRFQFWTKWFALKNNENFHERFLQSNPKFPLVLLTFTTGFLNGKLQFL